MDFASVRRRAAATTYAKRPRPQPGKPATPSAAIPSLGPSSDDSDTEQGVRTPPLPLPQSPKQPPPKVRATLARDVSQVSSQKRASPRDPPIAASASGQRQREASTMNALVSPEAASEPKPQAASPKKPPRTGSAARASRASASPKKKQQQAPQPRQPLPSRPAKDLDDIFELHSPKLDELDSFPSAFLAVSSGSGSGVDSQSQNASAGPSGTSGGRLDSPLLLGNTGLPSLERPGSPSLGVGAFPAKRAKLSQRMAPRTFKRVPTTEIETSTMLPPPEPRTLRRTETDPLAGRRLKEGRSEEVQTQPSLRTPILSQDAVEEPNVETRSLPGSPQRSGQASEGGELDTAARQRKFAAISQAPSTTVKRTYGNHRSFLADRVEDHLLGGAEDRADEGKLASNNVGGNIEDEIESQIHGNGSAQAGPSSGAAAALAFGLQPTRESYADLLKKWGDSYGDEDIEWDESQDPTLALKSITSLRSAGELRRFNDDLEYLFSGLSSSGSVSMRRSSAVEFVRLICGNPDVSVMSGIHVEGGTEDAAASAQSAEFLRKLRAIEGIVRVFDLFREASAGSAVDDVLDLTLAMFLGKLVKKPSTAEPLLRERRAEMLECLSSMLIRASKSGEHRRDGLVRLRLAETTGAKPLPRNDRLVLRELRSTAILSNLFLTGATHPSLRNMVIGTLCSISMLHKKLGAEVLRQMVQPEAGMEELPTLFSTVLQSYTAEGRKSKQRLADRSKGLELLAHSPFDTWPDLDGVDLCVRYIDRCMEMLYVGIGSSFAFEPAFLDSTVDILRAALEVAPLSPSPGTPSGAGDASEEGLHARAETERSLQVISGVVKLILDLTQIDAAWAHGFAASADLVAVLLRAMFLAEASGARQKGKAEDPPSLSPDPPEKHAQRVSALLDDLVHLSLAAVTNLLIKEGGRMRETLLKLRLNPHCWGRRSCAIKCRCEDRDRSLLQLSSLFFRKQKQAADDGDNDAAYLSNSLATSIAQFAVGGQSYLEAAQRAADAAHAKVVGDAGDSGFSAVLDAVEKFASDMQKGATKVGSAVPEGDADGELAQEAEQRVETEAEAVGEERVAAEEAGALIKELARELRSMANR